jgi:hypothetical protein
LLTGMTGNSLHKQWPLTSQSHGSVSQREQLVFCYESNSTPSLNLFLQHISGSMLWSQFSAIFAHFSRKHCLFLKN